MIKRTVFLFCPKHLWINRYSRQRRAEFIAEGGPGTGQPCTPGAQCHARPGSDLFAPGVTEDTIRQLVGAWKVNAR